MKVLVTGSRSISDYEFVASILDDLSWQIDTVVHGDAVGVDTCAKCWAEMGDRDDVDTEAHPVPDWAWEQIGISAEPRRNSYMLDQSDAVVAIWDGESTGTKDTFQKAHSRGMPLRKITVDVDDDGNVVEVQQDTVLDDDQAVLEDFCDE